MVCIGLGVLFIWRQERRCLKKVRYFVVGVFLSVTDFIFILLELVLDMFCSVGCSRVDCGIDMFVCLDWERVVR